MGRKDALVFAGHPIGRAFGAVLLGVGLVAVQGELVAWREVAFLVAAVGRGAAEPHLACGHPRLDPKWVRVRVQHHVGFPSALQHFVKTFCQGLLLEYFKTHGGNLREVTVRGVR